MNQLKNDPDGLRLRGSKDTVGDVARVLGKLEAADADLSILRLVANSTVAFRPFVLLSDALLNRGTLPPHTRECTILYLAARRGATYEWQEHVPMAAKAGVTDAERAALANSDALVSPVLSETSRLALRAADELMHGDLSVDTWGKLSEVFGQEPALELVLVIAWWGFFVPTVIRAIGRFGLD